LPLAQRLLSQLARRSMMTSWKRALCVLSLGFLAVGCGAEIDDSDLESHESALSGSNYPTGVVRIKSFINGGAIYPGGTRYGLCMDLAGGWLGKIPSGNGNGYVVQYACHTGSNQQWKLLPYNAYWSPAGNTFQIQSVANPYYCIGYDAVQTAGPQNGKILTLVPCIASTYMGYNYPDNRSLWNFDDVGGGVQKIAWSNGSTNWNDKFCVDVASGSSAESLELQTYSCNGGGNQDWYVMPF
jgi:hypothetical protein